MQGLASPFHLRPASQMGSTKNLEVNYVPFLDRAGLQKVKDGPPRVPIPLFLFLSRSLSIWGPVTTCPLAPCFFLPPLSLTTALQTIIKHLTSSTPPSPPTFSPTRLGYRRLYLGPGSSGMPRASLRPPLCKWFVCVIFRGYPWMQCWVAETIH